MKKKLLFLSLCVFFYCNLFSQIIINSNPPNNNIVYLIDNILLSTFLQTTNHNYEGDSLQIAYFNGVNSNIGLDGGIVMGTGDVSVLNPSNTQESPVSTNSGDEDLITLANSVPELIGQTFTVASVNDISALEFDFIASSDTLSFRYVFASEEYNAYENSLYNDVFGFFISGPGINGSYASPSTFPNGSINLATFVSQEDNSSGVELPITVSSINSFYNSQFYIDNQSLTTVAKADGFTTIMTAQTIVQCGETYHIRLAIADGTDNGVSSFIFLEENSFATNKLAILNNINNNQDSSLIRVKCGTKVKLTASVSTSFDGYDILWSNNDTTYSIDVGAGSYSFKVIKDNCVQFSDTVVIEEIPIQVRLGDDVSICRQDSIILNLKFNDGKAPYTYNWSTSETSEKIKVSNGYYTVEVTDSNNCVAEDDINILTLERPTATLSGGGNICEDQKEGFPIINIDFSGKPPFYYNLHNGNISIQDTCYSFSKSIEINQKGNYTVVSLKDSLCSGESTTSALVTYSSSSSLLSGGDLICEGDSTPIRVQSRVDAPPYMLYINNGSFDRVFGPFTDLDIQIFIKDTAVYTAKIIDKHACESILNEGVASVRFKKPIQPFITTTIDSILCPIDSSFLLEGTPTGGVFSGKGVDFDGFFSPINSNLGRNWVYYSFPENCDEVDSLAIEIGCKSEIFIPNSFTPNTDSDNDSFIIVGTNIVSFEISIFSRWGELIFKSNNIKESWNGKYKNKVVPKGVYTYVVSAYGKDANYFYEHGHVNVIK